MAFDHPDRHRQRARTGSDEVNKRPSARGGHIDLREVVVPLRPTLVDKRGRVARGLDDIAEWLKRGSAERDGDELEFGQTSLHQVLAAKAAKVSGLGHRRAAPIITGISGKERRNRPANT
jgi:hypothetical protein